VADNLALWRGTQGVFDLPWTGSGTFTRIYSWVSDAAAGINILASRMDTDTNDIVTNGLGNCLTRDGQGSPTSNLSMNGFHHTGASPGVADTDYLTVGQLRIAGSGGIIPAAAYLGEIRTTGLAESVIATAMPGWHVCAGQTRPRTDPLWVLVAVSGTWAFGGGDGSTTYTLPDMRGRAAFGKDDMNGSAANRLTLASGVGGAVLGANGGDQLLMAHTHAITDPGHGHGVNDPTHNHPINDPGHTHTESIVGNAAQGQFGVNAFFSQNTPGTTGVSTTGITTGSVGTGVTVAGNGTGITIPTGGGSGNSQNIPPALVLNSVIFTGA
jgi:microcystin-dependent protein